MTEVFCNITKNEVLCEGVCVCIEVIHVFSPIEKLVLQVQVQLQIAAMLEMFSLCVPAPGHHFLLCAISDFLP